MKWYRLQLDAEMALIDKNMPAVPLIDKAALICCVEYMRNSKKASLCRGVTVTITAMVVARMRVWSTRSTFCHGDGGCQNLIKAQRGGGHLCSSPYNKYNLRPPAADHNQPNQPINHVASSPDAEASRLELMSQQLLELSSGITQRAETQGLPVRDGILTHFHFQTHFL